MTKRIVVVGSINLDLVAAAERIPGPGETLAGSNFRTFPGGKGANQAVAAARLGARVSMLGKLGRDVFGGELRKSLEDAGVETSAVVNVPGPSGVALITTDIKGENSITVVGGANSQLAPEDIDANAEVLRSAEIILTQLEIPLGTIERLAHFARKEKVPLMLDPAPVRPLSPALLECVDWITPNEGEACSLLGYSPRELSQADLDDGATKLLQMGCRNVVFKLGARGCYLALNDGTRKRVPAYNVRAVDTTAAGDAFNGAFAAALLTGKDPISSASWATAVAAISVTRNGAQPSMPTSAEVELFLKENSASIT